MAANVEKVKIVVVGDSGVGKTSLVHLICHQEPTSNPPYTIGCSVEVKLHDYKAGTPGERSYFIEMWDIGGSTSHQNSRSIFYHSVHGIILVHDLSNSKSHQNLRKWLAEVMNRGTAKENNGGDYDSEQFAGIQIPIMVVGCKADQAQNLREKSPSGRSSIAEECGAVEFNLDCNQVKHISPGSTNAVKLTKFFDKVITRRYHSRDGGNQVNTATGNRLSYVFTD
ncbi:rab-like protein 3 isoform X2 [Ostrea edulis]|uniref:rab-like protein 3 isoform X2 n=1 Tax=Ostrea edulis TaxID=37623 RepID=UPI0020941CE6|nr:rab-like protein 3 isoform X2 [Ostrea edulis]